MCEHCGLEDGDAADDREGFVKPFEADDVVDELENK